MRNEIRFGKALAKSLAGDTTLAAMLTDSVAMTTVNIETNTIIGFLNSPISSTGSHITLLKMIVVADVMMTPIAAKTVIVVGSATTCPISAAARAIQERVARGGKLILFGNGGSATDANDWAIDCVLPPAGFGEFALEALDE